MPDNDNPFSRAAEARRQRSRAELDELEARLDARARDLDAREAKIDWQVEAAAAAIVAMVKDCKAGKVVPWAKFSQAALALEHTSAFGRRVPKEFTELLKSERVLDLEERKDTPTGPADR